MTEKQCIRCAERNVGNMKTHTINHINNFEYLLNRLCIDLFKEKRCHFFEGASPGEELVGSSIRDVAVGRNSGFLQRFCRFVYSIRIFFASAAHKYHAWQFFVFEVAWRIGSAGQKSVVAEGVGISERCIFCFHATHG